jgi:hypothetical protein
MTALRRWSITLITATVTAAVLLAAGFLVFGGGSEDGAGASPERLAATPPPAQSSSEASRIGPEGVPLPGGAPLGPARAPKKGESIAGVPCGSTEQLRYHVHARLTVFVNGKPRTVPLGIGIGTPRRIEKQPRGPFAANGSCFSFLHTHAADGIIHIEAPGQVTFKLGQFFELWGVRLDPRHLGPNTGRVTAYVNGTRYKGDPRGILLLKHAQIQLQVGKPQVKPNAIEFPAGL